MLTKLKGVIEDHELTASIPPSLCSPDQASSEGDLERYSRLIKPNVMFSRAFINQTFSDAQFVACMVNLELHAGGLNRWESKVL